MKRCPECRRDYMDDSLLYCLEDGTALVQGSVPSPDDPQTAILHDTAPPSEAATRAQIHLTGQTDVLPSGISEPKRFDIRLLLAPLALAVIVLGGFFGYRYVTEGKPIDSVAVLPFANVSGDPEFEFAVDGLAEALINNLSRLPKMKVIARSSSFTFKGKEVDPVEAATKLGVQAVVTGRVQQRGDSVTISVEMVNASDRTQMWGETYNRKASEIQSLQTEIARTISEKLRNRLTGELEKQLAKGETTNPQAYELNLKSLYFTRKGGRANSLKAVEYFEQAVAIDPLYANSWAALSVQYGNLARVGSSADRKALFQKQRAAVAKAMEIAPDSDQVLNAFGVSKTWEHKWTEGEAAYKQAFEINPNYGAAISNLANIYSVLKRHDEAIALSRQAIELDPLRAATRVSYMERLLRSGRFDEVIQEAPQASSLAPENALTYVYRGAAYERKKMYAEAIADLQKAGEIEKENIDFRIEVARIYASSGDRAKAEVISKENEPQLDKTSPVTLAGLYVALGENKQALDLLEKAFADSDADLRGLAVAYPLDPLRTEPRFKELLRKLNLPE